MSLRERQPLHHVPLNPPVLRGWKAYTLTWSCPDFKLLHSLLEELTSLLTPLATGWPCWAPNIHHLRVSHGWGCHAGPSHCHILFCWSLCPQGGAAMAQRWKWFLSEGEVLHLPTQSQDHGNFEDSWIYTLNRKLMTIRNVLCKECGAGVCYVGLIARGDWADPPWGPAHPCQ